MTPLDFETMTIEMKRDTVAREGTYLTYRRFDQGTAMLYQVRTFYVELILQQEGTGGPRFKAFDSEDFLDPYLETITLDALGFPQSN